MILDDTSFQYILLSMQSNLRSLFLYPHQPFSAFEMGSDSQINSGKRGLNCDQFLSILSKLRLLQSLEWEVIDCPRWTRYVLPVHHGRRPTAFAAQHAEGRCFVRPVSLVLTNRISCNLKARGRGWR